MKILIIGGHLSPALSVIEELRKNADIFYVGRKYAFEGDRALSLEFQTITALKIPFIQLTTGRLQRKFTRYTFFSIIKIPFGFINAFRILKKIKPEIVLGFGGYLSLPIIITAYVLKIPVIIHEQTLEAGLANKISAHFADRICISWESSRKFFPKHKSVLTGNPLRKEILDCKGEIEKKDQLLIYVTGGSLGSHKINELIGTNLESLLKEFRIIHQTGDAKRFLDFKKLSETKNSLRDDLKEKYEIYKFLTPVESAKALYRADLVVSRCGINTISELIFLKKPSFLVPLSVSQGNEQEKNALFLKSLGLAEVEKQEKLTPDIFLSKIKEMIRNLNNYKINTSDVYINKNSAEKIVEVLNNVYNAKKNKKK